MFYNIDVDIDESDVLDECSDRDLVKELQSRCTFRVEDYTDDIIQPSIYHDSEKLEYIKNILGLGSWVDNVKVIEALIKIF